MTTTYVVAKGSPVRLLTKGGEEFKHASRDFLFDDTEIMDEKLPYEAGMVGWKLFRIPANAAGILGVQVDDTALTIVDPYNAMNWQIMEGHPEPDVPAVPPPAAKSTIKDGTYTVVRDGIAGHITIRFRTDNEPLKRDGSRNTWCGKQFVEYLAGPDNDLDFFTFGTMESHGLNIWPKHRDKPSMIKYAAAVATIENADERGKFGEAYALISSRCCICGRTLTVPASIHQGMGPDCAARVGGF